MRMPGCISFKNSVLEHEDMMRIMFEAISVTNETSYVPGTGYAGGEEEEHDDGEDGEADGEGDGGAPQVTPSANKRPAPSSGRTTGSPSGKKKKTYRDTLMRRLVETYEKKAIDGTHIPVTVPKSELPKYVGRHHYSSQNVMAVCDFDVRFTFVVTGWPGSAHDTRVFLDTLVTYKESFPHPPQGKYYLVDSRYPNRKGYLAPYKGQRYHVPEWQHGRHPVGLKEVFNYHHASLRNVIERLFGVLKMKWRILLKVPRFPVNKQSQIIVACMALHNFIRETDINDEHFITYVDDIRDEDPSEDDSRGMI